MFGNQITLARKTHAEDHGVQRFEGESVHETMTRPDQSEGDRPRDELLAGEYVLGVLSAEARAKVEARMRTDKTFAAIVARWQENLSQPDDEYVTLVQPDMTYQMSRQGDLMLPQHSGRTNTVSSLLESLNFWRSLAFGFLFLLIGTVIFAERPGPAGNAAAPVLATLQVQDETPVGLVARYDAVSGSLSVTPASAGAGEPHSLQMWMTRGNEPAVSLGTLAQSGNSQIIVPASLRARLANSGAVLSITVEPPGGSPTGKPTGPLLASGEIQPR